MTGIDASTNTHKKGNIDRRMASIFTFDTNPVRVASPWTVGITLNPSPKPGYRPLEVAGMKMPPATSPTDLEITKLEVEPQEGSVEYKLHLLLRPRRKFSATSTVQKVSGSYLSKSRSPASTPEPTQRSGQSSPPLAPSNHSRQNRLQHLTTQLLWRLQQSSPNHTSSKTNLILPRLPNADLAFSASSGPGRLISGLEESLGALYEIGVSDDGTLVGLTMDELEESLVVLRAMAFSLGCDLRVLRLVMVGDCQWEESQTEKEIPALIRNEKLWVAEILVAPYLDSQEKDSGSVTPKTMAADNTNGHKKSEHVAPTETRSRSEQLRLSLTGITTSGKSSLLGTLSTSTLDNGRGKSRLSLLKHRHEIVSGVTSSLAQELIGYHDVLQGGETSAVRTNVVNYASGNVSSWTDIHNASDPGRLVFVTDSAGHPRYRRTTVRGLISWAPDWTLCCVAADDEEDSSGKVGATATSSEIFGSAGQDIDLSKAHLELCLKLGLPLVVVITKLDLASRSGLRQTLAKILSSLKSAGRKPAILSTSPERERDVHLTSISKLDMDAVEKLISASDPTETHLIVPIILTSAVAGSGIGRVHALLRCLPILPTSFQGLNEVAHTPKVNANPGTLFHVDEVFTVAESHDKTATAHANTGPRLVLSGYLRYGTLETGDSLLLGPFTSDTTLESADNLDVSRASSYPGLLKGSPILPAASSNWPRASSSEFSKATHDSKSRFKAAQTWQTVRITSLRYLRLPVQQMTAGQVGTIAITTPNRLYLNADPCVRRGMVLIAGAESTPSIEQSAYNRFTAAFKEPNAYVIPGSSVTVYIASIRASAKILEVRVPNSTATNDDMFIFDDRASDAGDLASRESAIQLEEIEITFHFANGREWVEIGTPVLVTPASGLSMLSPSERGDVGSSGLGGFVGKIVGGSA